MTSYFFFSECYFSSYVRGPSTLPPSAEIRGRALAELRRLSAVSDAARGHCWCARNRGGPRGAGAVARGGAVTSVPSLQGLCGKGQPGARLLARKEPVRDPCTRASCLRKWEEKLGHSGSSAVLVLARAGCNC